jgi:hypothetical protein
MTDSPVEPDPTQAPLPEADPGDAAGTTPGLDPDSVGEPPEPDEQDPGGPDTQIAPEKD